MKRFGLIIALTVIVCAVFAACTGNANNASKEASGQKAEATLGDASSTRVLTGKPSFNLPKLMMLGPLNPVPAVDENGKETEFFVLVVANLGYYQSLDQLRKSPFYAQLCDLYPELKDVKDVVDTGQGDLWFIRPWSKNTSLAINEYSMEMFLGEKSEDDAKVLYRTEDAKPMLLRMRADDPGSVKIHAVDNQKHVVTWIPTQTPSDNVLRQQAGIANITYNAVDNSAEFGTDYVATNEEGSTLIRFYADRQVRIGDQLSRYIAFHQEDGQIGLLIEGQGIESYATISGFAPDQQFSLTFHQGNDFGFGRDQEIVFINVNTMAQ
jgi:hypothetical protein